MSTTLAERGQTGDGLRSLAAGSMIAGALLQIVLGLALAPHQNPSSPIFGLISALNATSHLLLLAGVLGLLRSGAVGPTRLARGGLGLTSFGLVVLLLAEATALIDMESAVILFSVATLALMVGLILAGIAMLRSGHWTGWRRFTLLACGLFIPLVLLPRLCPAGLCLQLRDRRLGRLLAVAWALPPRDGRTGVLSRAIAACQERCTD